MSTALPSGSDDAEPTASGRMSGCRSSRWPAPTSVGAAGGSLGGGGGVNGEPLTQAGPPLAVPAGPPETEFATVAPEPSLRPQRAISPLPDEISCDMPGGDLRRRPSQVPDARFIDDAVEEAGRSSGGIHGRGEGGMVQAAGSRAVRYRDRLLELAVQVDHEVASVVGGGSVMPRAIGDDR